MTQGRQPDRDRAEIDALVADRYLDALLAAGDRRAADAPSDASLDPELRAAATALRRSLVRVHPSFRFEERLSARLRELAVQARPVARAADGATAASVIAWPGGAAGALDDPALEAILAGSLDPAAEGGSELEARLAAARRPLIVGGAITSAAISIVGVAWVAWRATRDARSGAAVDVVERAVRAAHARRDVVDAVVGGLGGPA